MDRTARANFIYEKSTKGTYRYKERPLEGEKPIIKQIYIQKHLLSERPPASIQVEITFDDGVEVDQ